MSVRIYSGPHSDRGGGPAGWLKALPWVFVGLTIFGQIIWVLVSGNTRVALTAFTVTTFFLASVTHAYLNRGSAWAAGYTAITLAFGWLIEVLGTITQFPFGDYSYTDALGPAVLGVPILIPMAWSMMAYPCLLAAQRLSNSALSTVMLAGWLLAAWDLFLDPQMVGEGYWTWNVIGWELPGIDGIPLQNFLGWLLSALVLMAILDRLPRKVANDSVPNTMLIWMFASNVFANLVFFGRPTVAIWGGVCMGLVVVPWMWRLWSQPRW
jgi:uncharacterized membrane protein